MYSTEHGVLRLVTMSNIKAETTDQGASCWFITGINMKSQRFESCPANGSDGNLTLTRANCVYGREMEKVELQWACKQRSTDFCCVVWSPTAARLCSLQSSKTQWSSCHLLWNNSPTSLFLSNWASCWWSFSLNPLCTFQHNWIGNSILLLSVAVKQSLSCRWKSEAKTEAYTYKQPVGWCWSSTSKNLHRSTKKVSRKGSKWCVFIRSTCSTAFFFFSEVRMTIPF